MRRAHTLRVISGDLRGRRLVVPSGLATRPPLDRVRTAVFDRLGAFVEGACVLDLFAGGGSLGIEALSRGARRCLFVERDPLALDALRANLDALGLTGRSTVIPRGASAETVERFVAGEGPFRLVFLDPPYSAWSEPGAGPALEPLAALVASRALDAEARILVRTPEGLPALRWPAGLVLVDRRAYGTTEVHVLGRTP
jgi:16S rRNA (guanine966-N2)-methyltransferase